MMVSRKLASLLLASTLCASLARATSPTPPVGVVVEPDGRGSVRLAIATTASGDYTVTVRKTGARQAGELAAAPRPLTEGNVHKDSPVIVRDTIAMDAAAGDVVHVNYQVEVVSAERGYHGFVAVDQAFVVEGDGTLRPITLEQELELASGPAPVALTNGDISAGDPSPAPRQ